ncbi:bifunctional phosphoglucose/phosphomannose isomerase [Candidatus Bipolaricaulota bacterium]|nr:bifunctional phosphoglucose/phosphomannose isomerase [Candidatus Bipolaricaulota bacterium]
MSVYAVIMAGGKGERLWPASTPARPKPFLPLGKGGKSLIQATYDRVLPLTGRERLYVVADSELAPRIKAALGLADFQLLVEPQGRNTAPAIGLAALAISRVDPAGIVIVLPADHLIEDEGAFRRALEAAVQAGEEGHLVTLGIKPASPATGYGYIQQGELLGSAHGHDIFKVKRFTEKPDEETARRFLSEGGYYWNSGIFIWRADRILEEIDRFLPKLSQALKGLAGLWGKPGWEDALRRAWQEVEAISIDYGVMERAEDVVVIPVGFGWHDLGDWQAVWEVLPKDGAGVAARGEHLGVDTARALVWARPGKTVATLGVSDVAIVDTQEALLVADMKRSQKVRELARQARPAPPKWEKLLELDTSGMLEVVAGFPDQCRQGLELGEEVALPPGLSGFSQVLCVGMGGSGITGDLLGRLLSVPVFSFRGYRVPGYIGEETLLVGVSYSGNTEETLSAFEEGLSRTRRALAISSGGKLRELCARRKIPWIGIPSGYQPRAALGYLLFTLLSVLRRLGAAHLDLKEALEVLAGQARALGPASPGNRAQAIAQALAGGVPLIYGTNGNTGPVAFRWKTQINENAKQPAFWAELPELCHNEIVGWELAERVLPGGRVVFLRSGHDHPRVQARIEILKEVLLRRGLSYLEVEGEGESEAAQLFSLLYLGDWVSVYLALLNGVDPTPVRPIQELKERLAGI